MLLDELGTTLDAHTDFTLATNLFLGKAPPTPDTAVTVYEYAGATHQSMGTTIAKNTQPRVQVMSRAKDYPTARARAQTASDQLSGLVMSSVSGATLTVIALQDPFFVGVDDSGRVQIAVNFEVTRSV